jgi:hypothetical protein
VATARFTGSAAASVWLDVIDPVVSAASSADGRFAETTFVPRRASAATTFALRPATLVRDGRAGERRAGAAGGSARSIVPVFSVFSVSLVFAFCSAFLG